MLGPPLQYQSLKTVLLHIDPNTRFRISAHMPLIRDVEKVVPLKICSLRICDDCTIFVNGTEYQVGIFRHSPTDNDPSAIAPESRLMGSLWDFDEFGFPFHAGNNVMLPGDVSFQMENRPEFRRDTEDDERSNRDHLRIHEEALKMQAELESKGITVEDYLKSIAPIPGERRDGEEENKRRILMLSKEKLSRGIKLFKCNLIPYDCRRDNTKPPFTFYIQLDITKGKSRQIQRFEYNKKLFEASKGLNEALFGRRTVPIQVGRLFLRAYITIYRLPVGFRLHAKHVRTYEHVLAHASFRLFVENSDRLESIKMTNGERGDAFQTEAVRRVKNLVIDHSYNYEIQRLTQIIGNLPNLEITIEDLRCSPEEIFILIQAWLSADRPIGAFFCIIVENEVIAELILTLVRTRHERANRTARCVTIQKTESTRAEVFYVPFTASRIYTQNMQWLLKTRIVNA